MCAAVALFPRLASSSILIDGAKSLLLGFFVFCNDSFGFGGLVGAKAGAGFKENQTSVLGGSFHSLLLLELFLSLDWSTGAG